LLLLSSASPPDRKMAAIAENDGYLLIAQDLCVMQRDEVQPRFHQALAMEALQAALNDHENVTTEQVIAKFGAGGNGRGTGAVGAISQGVQRLRDAGLPWPEVCTRLCTENAAYLRGGGHKTHRLLVAILHLSLMNGGTVRQRLLCLTRLACTEKEQRDGNGEIFDCINLFLAKLHNEAPELQCQPWFQELRIDRLRSRSPQPLQRLRSRSPQPLQ